ncbi:winged helix-turn-helix domain-containing protein [Phytoactinopolyspora mesophila]|uniref:GntR family transcriptional regulator n=1 Tax=Phytoactinopolyspora mesophila TaxID=2650750 RepID=A0A7K3M052_9ACTN|nr:winged helix-turn-helix domain-containing protein [Phytoactinopolyspora mesophila]NDL56292.1 GntR family transcriptional regulator [Phytoactinopolyspora mesophila]
MSDLAHGRQPVPTDASDPSQPSETTPFDATLTETPEPSAAQPSVTIPEFDPDARGNGYVYLRLADHLAARIEARDLPPGTQLPAERDLAMQYGVSIGTVRRVAAELRNRDLILTLPAKGTYVRR